MFLSHTPKLFSQNTAGINECPSFYNFYLAIGAIWWCSVTYVTKKKRSPNFCVKKNKNESLSVRTDGRMALLVWLRPGSWRFDVAAVFCQIFRKLQGALKPRSFNTILSRTFQTKVFLREFY